MPDPIRLTSPAHGGGCKLAPAAAREILARMPAAATLLNLIAGASRMVGRRRAGEPGVRVVDAAFPA